MFNCTDFLFQFIALKSLLLLFVPVFLPGPLVSPNSVPNNLDGNKAVERRPSKVGVSRESSSVDFSKVTWPEYWAQKQSHHGGSRAHVQVHSCFSSVSVLLTDISVACVENCLYRASSITFPSAPVLLRSARGILSHCFTCNGLRIDQSPYIVM